KKYISSAWIISIIRGFIIGFLIFLAAPFVPQFFNSPDSLPLLRLIALVPILRGFINPSEVYFQKELQFHKEFFFRFLILLLDGVTAVFFAFLTRSAVSIVFGMMVGVLAEIFLSFAVIKPWPSLVLEREYLAKLFHRGKWVTLSGIFNYLFHNFDNIVVGRLLGTAPLGLYQMAYSFSMLLIREIADVFSRVTFPVYSKISEDRPRLKTAFIKTMLTITFLALPFGLILFLFPRLIISLVLGPKWLGAVPVLKILALFSTVRTISGSASALFLAVGKQEYVTVVTLVSILGMAIPIIPLVLHFGIIGAAASAVIGAVLAVPFFAYFVVKIFTFTNDDER
ncbi:oligosaccharide flippase family protein, partial [Patescibacteria group bacterium]|nr:oligosaccharide flippase family protein [Patescibacteria group bacterium]